ncbi:MAG: double-stranded DNA repair protein Rad50 [Candidatus Nitrosocaldaceae archaeon]|nr:MAG: double-stranded DNA repair protein Rad50 [Candidatus Nitrosocaldaceae archaeon]
MIIDKLTLDGFLCFKHKEFKLASDKVLIYGSNGSGKSSFIDAILFALYGKPIRQLQLINNESDKAVVTLEFTLNSDRYNVTRSINREGELQSQFLKNENKIEEGEISNILGSLDNFASQTLIEQDFVRLIDYPVINACKEIFNIHKYDEYKERIEKKIEDDNLLLYKLEDELNIIKSIGSSPKSKEGIENEIKDLVKEKKKYEITIEKIKKKLIMLEKKEANAIKAKSTLDEIRAKLIILEEELKNKQIMLEKLAFNKEEFNKIKNDYNEFIKLRNKLVVLEEKRIKYESLTNSIALIEALLEEKDKLSTKLSEDLKNIKQRYKESNIELKKLREEMIKLDKEKIELENKRYKLDAEINLAKERLSNIIEQTKVTRKDKTCPICKQQLDKVKELISHMNEEANNIKSDIKEKEKELAVVLRKLREVDSNIRKVEMMIAKAETTTKSMVEELEQKSIDLKHEIDMLNTKLLKYKKELTLLKFDPNIYTKNKSRYDELLKTDIINEYVRSNARFIEWQSITQEINKIKGNITALTKKIITLEKTANEYDKIRKELLDTRIELTKLNGKLEQLNSLLESKQEELSALDTYRYESLDTKIEELNKKIEDIKSEIKTLEELRSILDESLSDTISKIINAIRPYLDRFTEGLGDLYYNDNMLFLNDYSIDSLSRGEKMYIYIALRLAYLQAINTQLIIMDNNLSLLDDKKIEMLLANIDKPLIVLTHKDIKPFFNTVIEL